MVQSSTTIAFWIGPHSANASALEAHQLAARLRLASRLLTQELRVRSGDSGTANALQKRRDLQRRSIAAPKKSLSTAFNRIRVQDPENGTNSSGLCNVNSIACQLGSLSVGSGNLFP